MGRRDPSGPAAVRQQLAPLELVVADDLAEQQPGAVLDRQRDRVTRAASRRGTRTAAAGPWPAAVRTAPCDSARSSAGESPVASTSMPDCVPSPTTPASQAGAELVVVARPHHPHPGALRRRRRRHVVRARPDVGQVVGLGAEPLGEALAVERRVLREQVGAVRPVQLLVAQPRRQQPGVRELRPAAGRRPRARTHRSARGAVGEPALLPDPRHRQPVGDQRRRPTAPHQDGGVVGPAVVGQLDRPQDLRVSTRCLPRRGESSSRALSAKSATGRNVCIGAVTRRPAAARTQLAASTHDPAARRPGRRPSRRPGSARELTIATGMPASRPAARSGSRSSRSASEPSTSRLPADSTRPKQCSTRSRGTVSPKNTTSGFSGRPAGQAADHDEPVEHLVGQLGVAVGVDLVDRGPKSGWPPAAARRAPRRPRRRRSPGTPSGPGRRAARRRPRRRPAWCSPSTFCVMTPAEQPGRLQLGDRAVPAFGRAPRICRQPM